MNLRTKLRVKKNATQTPRIKAKAIIASQLHNAYVLNDESIDHLYNKYNTIHKWINSDFKREDIEKNNRASNNCLDISDLINGSKFNDINPNKNSSFNRDSTKNLYKYFLPKSGITYGIDRVKIKIDNIIMSSPFYWQSKGNSSGYRLDYAKVESKFVKMARLNYKIHKHQHSITATLYLPFASSIMSNNDYFNSSTILHAVNELLESVGIRKVRARSITINELDFFVDYKLPDRYSYQLLEQQHTASFNPAYNKRYRLDHYSETIYVASTISSTFQNSFKNKFCIYNKTKQLKKKKYITSDLNSIARFESKITAYRLNQLAGGKFTLDKWFKPEILLHYMYNDYSRLFLFDSQPIVDPLNDLKKLKTFTEFNDYYKVKFIDSLINDGFTLAAITEFLEESTTMSKSSVYRLRKTYEQNAHLLASHKDKSVLTSVKSLLEDELENYQTIQEIK